MKTHIDIVSFLLLSIYLPAEMLCPPKYTLISDFLNGWTQCAAVSTCLSETIAPPQYNRLPLNRPTIHGYSLASVSLPPTIRSLRPRTPQTENEVYNAIQIFITQNIMIQLTNNMIYKLDSPQSHDLNDVGRAYATLNSNKRINVESILSSQISETL